MVLDEVCNSNVYHANAYYMLRLPIMAGLSQIKRRGDALEDAEFMGEADWRDEFANRLLGYRGVPSLEEVQGLKHRLETDSEFQATERFFWLWPSGTGDTTAVDAVFEGHRDAAFRSWLSLAAGPSPLEAVIAKHNMAVLLQYYAIDAEKSRLAGEAKTTTDIFLKVLDEFWWQSFELWEDLVRDEDGCFWDHFRRLAGDDPRLGENFISNFREYFPIAFDNINADFMAAYAQAGRADDARRHYDYMRETMEGLDDVEKSTRKFFAPVLEQFRILIERLNENTVARSGLRIVSEMIADFHAKFKVFRLLGLGDSPMCRDLRNEIAMACDVKLAAYARETEDQEGAQAETRKLLEIAATPVIRNRVNTAIEQYQGIIERKRERDTCWICKTYRRGMSRKTVTMHGDVVPDPRQLGAVNYRHTQIDIPMCTSCQRSFSTAQILEYPEVRSRLNIGWKFGYEVSQQEIQDAWIDILAEMGSLMGNRNRRYY